MDKSYMLDDYISEKDKSLVEKQEAEDNLDKLEFRIHGSKTVEEIKKQVSIFLEKNDIPVEVEEELNKICSEFNDNTDVYQASLYVENFMKEYLENKDKEYQKSNDTVFEIKEDLVDSVKKALDDIGIVMTGNRDTFIERIQSENDVYKLKDNVYRTTEYFEERKNLLDENKTLVELPTEEVTDVLENPTDVTLLNNVLEQKEQEIEINNDPQVQVNDDGSIVVEGDTLNLESMNFAAMMTTALVVDNTLSGLDQNLDMKFIKETESDSKFKIVYADFPLHNNNVDPMLMSKINSLVNNYQSQVSYMELLGTKSPELMIALTLINEQVLNRNGAFQMAVKSKEDNHDMRFALDENYADIYTAFGQSGAMVSHDEMENGIIMVNDNMTGEQLLILSTALENLRQREKEAIEAQSGLQNQPQKSLGSYGMNNEVANVNKTFLMVALVAEILLAVVGIYFIFS